MKAIDSRYSQNKYCSDKFNTSLLIITNMDVFNDAIEICSNDLNLDCWIGLQRVGCDQAFDKTTQTFNESSHEWQWDDGTPYNATFMNELWCPGLTPGDPQWPHKFPKWYRQEEFHDRFINDQLLEIEKISGISQFSFCGAQYVYIDKHEKCLKNSQDSKDTFWGNERVELHKAALYITDGVLYSSKNKTDINGFMNYIFDNILLFLVFGLFVIVIPWMIIVCLICKLNRKINVKNVYYPNLERNGSLTISDFEVITKVGIDSKSIDIGEDVYSISDLHDHIGSDSQGHGLRD